MFTLQMSSSLNEKKKIVELVRDFVNYRAYIGTLTHCILPMLNEGLTIPAELPIDDQGNVSNDGEIQQIPEEVKIRVGNYQKFFLDVYSPTFLGNEISIYSKNLPFAGTCDLVCEINGVRWLVDYKTGSGIYDGHKVQIMMYKELVEEVYKLKIDKIGLLQLHDKKRKRKLKIKEIEYDPKWVKSVVYCFIKSNEKLFKE